MRKTDADGIGAQLSGHYLLLKTRKGKRALATAIGLLPKVRVIKAPSNAPAKNRIAGRIPNETTSRGALREEGLAATPLLLRVQR